MEKKWEEMSSDEKQEAQLQKWLSPKDPEGNDLQFQSPQAEKAFKERATRLKDAIQMKKRPDRVPVFTIYGFFPALYAGFTPQEVMYDYDKCNIAWKKYVLDFAPDGHIGPWVPGPGKLFDILDYKLYKWPGHGVSPEYGYQCNEGEYMKADEYDAFIDDPSNFYSNIYLPRIFGALEHFTTPHIADVLEMYGAGLNFIPYGVPPVQAAYKALLEAGNEALKYIGVVGACNNELAAAGFPTFWDGPAKAPFDMIGDTLRGTKGIMVDMYRQPDKLLKAMEVMTPLVVKNAVAGAKVGGVPIVAVVMHKGADGFLSDEQYKKFYWPTFRRVLMGLIAEGIVPFCFAEGGYNSRLEIIRDLPKGKVIWWLDRTDMAKAKEVLGDVACIGGNLPPGLLAVGTPQQVKDYTKKLIDTCAKGGGYILGNGTVMEQAKPENLHAMIDTAKEYGVYK
ncbi:MAG: uroporphyrinogen decarboxylase [Deltaproteobacteria bacterium]|nr:MAG: uroporphyrinogen decarboxylase [Deltaproteobacteria bacterium]